MSYNPRLPTKSSVNRFSGKSYIDLRKKALQTSRVNDLKKRPGLTGKETTDFLLRRKSGSKNYLTAGEKEKIKTAAKRLNIRTSQKGDVIYSDISKDKFKRFVGELKEGGYKFDIEARKRSAEGLAKKITEEKIKEAVNEEMARLEKEQPRRELIMPRVQETIDRMQNLNRPEQTKGSINTQAKTTISEEPSVSVSELTGKREGGQAETQKTKSSQVAPLAGSSFGRAGQNIQSDEESDEGFLGTSPINPSAKDSLKPSELTKNQASSFDKKNENKESEDEEEVIELQI